MCNIFNEVLLDGQVCYQADLTKDKIRDMVDKRKIATDGFVMLLDYNENRMVELGDDLEIGEDSPLLGKREEDKDVMLYVETVGKNLQYLKDFVQLGPRPKPKALTQSRTLKCLLTTTHPQLTF